MFRRRYDLFGVIIVPNSACEIVPNQLFTFKLFATRSYQWVPELQRYIKKYNEEHGTSKVPPIVLVGNKLDIWDHAKVPEASIKSVVDECDMIKSYKLCSARSGDGLEDTFQEACRVALAGTKPKATKKKGCSIL